MSKKLQLHGAFPSKAGLSAYEVAQKNGFEGTEAEWLESLKADVDLTDYVKRTDYAGQSVGGVVRCGEGLYMSSTGKINVSAAEISHITAKATNGRVITPANLDRAVKSGICANSIALTDEEKVAAQEWLGIEQGSEGSGAVIDDNTVSSDTTWSSEKILTDCVHHYTENHVGGYVEIESTGNYTIGDVITSITPGEADYVQVAFEKGAQWVFDDNYYKLLIPLPVGTYKLRIQTQASVYGLPEIILSDLNGTIPQNSERESVVSLDFTDELQEHEFTVNSDTDELVYIAIVNSGVPGDIEVFEIIGTPDLPMSWQLELSYPITLTIAHENGTKTVTITPYTDFQCPVFSGSKINWTTGEVAVSGDLTVIDGIFPPVDFSDVTGEATCKVEIQGVYAETSVGVMTRLTANEAFQGLKDDLGSIESALDSIIAIQNNLIGGDSA